MAKGGRNTKIHAICDEKGRSMAVELTAGNVNDCTTAISLIDRMPAGAKTLLADKGYDTDKIREKLEEKEIEACIPSKVNPDVRNSGNCIFCILCGLSMPC